MFDYDDDPPEDYDHEPLKLEVCTISVREYEGHEMYLELPSGVSYHLALEDVTQLNDHIAVVYGPIDPYREPEDQQLEFEVKEVLRDELTDLFEQHGLSADEVSGDFVIRGEDGTFGDEALQSILDRLRTMGFEPTKVTEES